MKPINGITIAKRIREVFSLVDIIFITGLSNYMPEAFFLNATNYILKPIDKNIFYKALDFYVERNKIKTVEEKYFYVKLNNYLEKIKRKDIMCFEKIGNAVIIHINNI